MRAPPIALAETLGDDGDVERNLRDQDRIGSAGDAGVQRDPPGVAAHHFHDHDAPVRFGRRMQAIDRIGREVDGRVESEAVRRPDDIVVDGLRDADDRDALLAEFVRDRERAVAADDHQRAQLHLVEHLDDAIGIVPRAIGCLDHLGERIPAVHRAENRAAEPQDAGDVARRERARAARLDQAVEAVLDADALDAAVGRRLDDCANDGVETGGVAAAGEDAESLRHGFRL